MVLTEQVPLCHPTYRNTVQRSSHVVSNVFLLQPEERAAASDTEDEEDQSEDDIEIDKCTENSCTPGRYK